MIYTAPDGKTFEDRGDYRQYVFETFYTFRDRARETLRKEPGQIDGQPFDLSDLTGCDVELLDHCAQARPPRAPPTDYHHRPQPHRSDPLLLVLCPRTQAAARRQRGAR